MGLLRLHVSVVLRHILDKRFKLGDNDNDEEDEEEEEEEEDLQTSREPLASSTKRARRREDSLLDFQGPKLILGLRNWLFFYQLIGQINWNNRPLYLSILYKLLVFCLVIYVQSTSIILRFYQLHLISDSFRNPIFLFISGLAFLTFTAQIFVTLRVNLLDLCPLYKVLTTERLCYLKEEALHILGTNSLGFVLIFHVYNALILNMIVNKNLEEFIQHFHLPSFLLHVYTSTVITYYLIGLTQVDLYVRSAFGHWLLALKSHLELQFTQLHRAQQQQRRPSTRGGPGPGQNQHELHLITLDEVQKSLNHMDDHLEVLRSIQTVTLVLMTLNAFLGNGAMLLLTYHLIADQANYYHGFLFLLLSLSYITAIFLSYSGDRLVFYALSSFVQSVEDEYFMQRDRGPATRCPRNLDELEELEDAERLDFRHRQAQEEMLMIKKKDVLFCREFLHQFENHLATPWSKLTFKSHLHMLRTFVTLIAAQIIFDHEH